jgi:hypothetical protein
MTMRPSVLLLFVMAVSAVVLMVFRGDMPFIPGVVDDSLPNFVPTAFSPLLVIRRRRAAQFGDYLQFALGMFAAMSVYEVLQLWMPRRTFDWGDIAASALGIPVALFFGLLFSPGRSSRDICQYHGS